MSDKGKAVRKGMTKRVAVRNKSEPLQDSQRGSEFLQDSCNTTESDAKTPYGFVVGTDHVIVLHRAQSRWFRLPQDVFNTSLQPIADRFGHSKHVRRNTKYMFTYLTQANCSGRPDTLVNEQDKGDAIYQLNHQAMDAKIFNWPCE